MKRGFIRKEAANYFGISPTTFDKWIAVGRMPRGVKIGGNQERLGGLAMEKWEND